MPAGHYYDPVLEENPHTVRAVITTAVFYCSLIVGQHIAAVKPFLRLHATSLPVSILARCAVVGGAAAMTQSLSYPLFNKFLSERKRVVSREKVRRALLTFCGYALIEQLTFPGVSPLKTSLPSSILTTGSYASVFGGAIPSSSSVASPYQRTLIQRMGRAHGCHHCGSRQLFGSGTYFIADHMPPTKLVDKMNKAFLRRLLRIEVAQSLMPQCLACFSMQGNAVKRHIHVPVFQYGPRLVYLAPLLATWLAENPYFGKHLKKLTNPLVDAIAEVEKEMKSRARQR